MQIKMVPDDFIPHPSQIIKGQRPPVASTLEKGGGGGDQVRRYITQFPEVGEKALSVNCLLCKHQDLSLGPQYLHKAQGLW